MTFKRRALAQRIRSEIPELGHAVAGALRHWKRASAEPEDQEYRRFPRRVRHRVPHRVPHRVRNIYAANLNASQLESLVSELAGTWEALKTELGAFCDFLDSLSGSE